MEKIRLEGWETYFQIYSIQPVATHILRIVYVDVMPNETGYSRNIIIYTQGGIESATLTGWNTVYYSDSGNKTVYLSDDGSVYTEPEEPKTGEPDTDEPEPDEPYEPSIEELQTYKISEMQSACASAVKSGIDVNGEHFSLGTDAELALIVRQHEIDSGKTEIDFYPDGEPSKYYTAEEMQAIIDTANAFINGHEVYCNELCLWIKTLTDAEEIESVYYGMDIPEEHRSGVLSDLIFHSKDELHDEEEDKPDDDSDGGETPDDNPDEDDENIGAGDKMDLGDGN